MPTRYVLKLPCAVRGCVGQNKLLENWVCAEDGGTMYVDEDGFLSCHKELHRAKIVYWTFDCCREDSESKHSVKLQATPDLEGFGHAMAIGPPQLKEAGTDWVTTLMENIEKQYMQTDE